MSEKRTRAALLTVVAVALSVLAAVGTASSAGAATIAEAAPINGHFCYLPGVASTDKDQTPHAEVCFTNYSAYMAALSGGLIKLDPATKPKSLSDADLEIINR